MSSTDAVVERMTALLAEWGVNTVKQELVKINDKLASVQNEQSELKQALGNTQKECEETKSIVNKLTLENKELQSRVEFSENKISHLESSLEKCMQKMVDNQARSMSDNIVFHNIREERRENPREVLVSFMKEMMNISEHSFEVGRLDDADTIDKTIWIKRCYRLGPYDAGRAKPRPIIAILVSGKDWIMKHTRYLAGTKYFVTTQIPPEIAENKRKVTAIFKQAKLDGKKPRYVARGDVVAVDNKTYKAPVAPSCKLPPKEILANKDRYHLRSSNVIEARGNKFVAHMATISSPADIAPALNAIKYTYHSVSIATHNMYGARIQVGSGIHEYCDDDGEHGGAREIMNVLQARNVTDKLVVVTRWASGVQLGGKRFSIIASCAGNVVGRTSETREPVHSSPEERSRRSSRGYNEANMAQMHRQQSDSIPRDCIPHDNVLQPVISSQQQHDPQPPIMQQSDRQATSRQHDIESGLFH
jgi:hypothetical protein